MVHAGVFQKVERVGLQPCKRSRVKTTPPINMGLVWTWNSVASMPRETMRLKI